MRLPKNETTLPNAGNCALLSEASLAKDWNKPEEDEAWKGFQWTKYGKHQIKLSGKNMMIYPQDDMVYVVSLSQKPIKENCDYRWADAVEKDKHYFHPIKKTWPSVPPNYIAFRYGGQLQSVHQIKSYKVVTDTSSENKNWPKTDSEHFVYDLGPAMEPPVIVRNGSIWPSGRYWCAIDTLLSGACKTISDARDETKRRLNAINH